MSLRTRILLFLFIFALLPLLAAVVINLPLVLERVDLFYRQAFLQNLRGDFSDLDQHLASRESLVSLLAKLPDPALSGPDASQPAQRVEWERARYTDWVNRVLHDASDVTQIRFVDARGKDRFWLSRDPATGRFLARSAPLPRLSKVLREAIEKDGLKGVTTSALHIGNEQDRPQRQDLSLHMLAPILTRRGDRGAVVATVDITDLVRRNKNTLWVLNDGRFLQLPGMPGHARTAFQTFPGLREDFARKRTVLWEHGQHQMIWVPMFETESGAPLWVGREVDNAPLKEFRSEIVRRVLAIIFGLILLLLISARILAQRAERIGRELLDGIQKTLDSDQPVLFEWPDTRELRQLSADLTQLSRRHATQTRNLRAHTRELEESNRYKSEFLANVSHELRTPLNSILLLSKLLSGAETGLRGEQREQARVIHKAGNDLRQLIDNILDLSRIESGQHQVQCEPVDVRALMDDVRVLLQPQFDQKGLPLRVEFINGAPTAIRSDPDKIRQVLKNFVANALKFTERGQVRLLAGPASAPYALELAVTDTGIGIPEDHHQRVFEAFQQADGSTSRRYGGTGLGLTISRQLASLLHGEIRLVSRPEEGATFSLLLPLSCDEDGPVQPALAEGGPLMSPVEAPLPPGQGAAVDLHGIHVLLMEGDVKTQLRLSQLLNRCNVRVSLANDLEEACESLDDAGPAALLLVDPLLFDREACATIQAIKTHNKTPMSVVAVAASDRQSESVCSAMQPDHVLGRPVQVDQFLDLMRRCKPPEER